MDTGTKILVGGLSALGVLLLIRQSSAALAANAKSPAQPAPPGTLVKPAPDASTPPPPAVKPFMVLPASQNNVLRSADPPSNATVPPGAFVATFRGPLFLSTTIDELNGTAIGPVPPGTLLASVDIMTSRALQGPLEGSQSIGGNFPVSWVSPEGDRIAFTPGDFLMLHDVDSASLKGRLFIAQKA